MFPSLMYLLCNKITSNFKLIAGLISVYKFGNIHYPVGIAIGLGAGRSGNLGSIPGRGKSFPLPHTLHTSCEGPPIEYQGVVCTGMKAAGA
jgi:hypothetical protein